MLTQAYVQHLFDYRDGMLYRKHTAANGKIKIGDPAGRYHRAAGRMRICIDGKRYYFHHVIYLWHHSFIPNIVDHIDCDPLNNRIENLRGATVSDNNCNKSLQKNNTTGIKGISMYSEKKMIHAQIQRNGKKIHKTFFPINDENMKLALQWLNEMRQEVHGEFANHG
jgi:hypothetical protein